MIIGVRVRPLSQWCASCLSKPHNPDMVGITIYIDTSIMKHSSTCNGRMWRITDESDIELDRLGGVKEHGRYGQAWMCEHVLEVAD